MTPPVGKQSPTKQGMGRGPIPGRIIPGGRGKLTPTKQLTPVGLKGLARKRLEGM